MSNDKDDLNVIEMLIDIRERLARVEENTSKLDSTAIKASTEPKVAPEEKTEASTSNGTEV